MSLRPTHLLLRSRGSALQHPDLSAPTTTSADFCTVTPLYATRRAARPEWRMLPVSSTRRGQLATALGALMYRASPTGEYRQLVAPLAAQISLVKMRELSVHKRSIKLRRRTGGLCCHVPACLDPPGLLCGFCSSSRTFALRLPPDQPLRASPCLRLVATMISISAFRFSHRGLAPHKFAPVLGAH